jgi:ATP-binding cassette subfamily F protein 3
VRELAAGKEIVVRPHGGEGAVDPDLDIGYFAQHQLEQLKEGASPLQHLRDMGGPAAVKATEQELRDFLGTFGFRGDLVFEPIGPFSGGEKARLVLALLTYLRPNLLLLDEPTNHLDLEMRQALALALQDYEGAVLMVSHDRHLLRTVIDEFYLVADGRAKPFDGDLDDYAKWAASNPREVAEKAVKAVKAPRTQAAPRKSVSALKTELATIDKQLVRLHQQQQDIEQQLSAPDIYAADNKASLRELLEQQATLKQELSQVEANWLAAAESLQREGSDSIGTGV